MIEPYTLGRRATVADLGVDSRGASAHGANDAGDEASASGPGSELSDGSPIQQDAPTSGPS